MVKIDFLALGMLSSIDRTLDLIDKHRGVGVDLSRIDFKDDAVYDRICAADTIGTFQVESRAQQQLPRVRPRSLDDMTVQVAIIRPGPIVGGSVNPFINRRRGLEPIAYDHPSLKPVLEETWGVILYQDQVLQVAMAIAGFSAGQADALRRAMTSKRSHEAITKMKDVFILGCLKNGVSMEVAKRVFGKIEGFQEYGFPKSHAVAFGLMAYQSCYLKYYYPAEFLCGLLNEQPMGFYPPAVLINDAKRRGVQVLPPNINASGADCTIENGAVRIGLRYTAELGLDAAREVERERSNGGAYRSLYSFIQRTKLKKRVMANLITAGAFGSLNSVGWQLYGSWDYCIVPKGVRQMNVSSQHHYR